MDATDRQLVLVDFDRTLFDLDKFYKSVWRELAAMYGFDADDAFMNMRNFYYEAHGGYHGTYSFANHLHFFAPEADEHQTIQILRDRLHGTRMLYDDADVIFEWAKRFEVRVLSFGETHLQEFKMSFCPELSVIPNDFILSPKPQFITERFAGRKGFLVDNKIETGLPEGIELIWLNREDNIEKYSKDANIVVNSLKQATEFL